MFFIAGITGQVGGAAARHLREHGHRLRALVRDPAKAAEWTKLGVEVCQGDLDDPMAVAAALEGVAGAFLMMPPILIPSPGYEEAKATVASYRQALRQASPPRVVLLSSFGSQQTHGLGNITSTQLMEQGLSDLPIPTAFIRPGSFMENYTYGLQQAAASGTFDIFLTPTNRTVPMTATEDIGREVALLLVRGWRGKKIVELGSRFSPDDLATGISEALGRPVQARAVPREQLTVSLGFMGFPPDATGSYEEMIDGINSGWIDFGVPGTEAVAGTFSPGQFFKQVKKGGAI